MNSCGNDGPGGWNCSMKISVHFISIYPLKKSNFCPFSPPLVVSLLSILAPKWAASTLICVLNIVSKDHIYLFHIKILRQHVSVQRSRCHHDRRNYLRPGLYVPVPLTWLHPCDVKWSRVPSNPRRVHVRTHYAKLICDLTRDFSNTGFGRAESQYFPVEREM